MMINGEPVIAISVDNEEPSFSYNGCDNCNNRLGNDVYKTKVYTSIQDIENENHYTIDLCNICLCAYHNSDELDYECKNEYQI